MITSIEGHRAVHPDAIESQDGGHAGTIFHKNGIRQIRVHGDKNPDIYIPIEDFEEMMNAYAIYGIGCIREFRTVDVVYEQKGT